MEPLEYKTLPYSIKPQTLCFRGEALNSVHTKYGEFRWQAAFQFFQLDFSYIGYSYDADKHTLELDPRLRYRTTDKFISIDARPAEPSRYKNFHWGPNEEFLEDRFGLPLLPQAPTVDKQ